MAIESYGGDTTAALEDVSSGYASAITSRRAEEVLAL
jgi:hypothetical protein